MTGAATDREEFLTIEIGRLGAGGDGIAVTGAGPVYVPFALPGERVAVRLGAREGQGRHATVVSRESESPDRVVPPCMHFGACGGCAMQHLAIAPYLAWKRAIVAEALRRRGLPDDIVAAPVSVGPGTRRTARFGARRTKDGLVLGFTGAGGETLVDVHACDVLVPEIVAALPALRDIVRVALAPGGFADIPVILTESGLDVVLRTSRAPDVGQRQRLARLANDAGLARLSWQEAGTSRRRVAGPPEPVASLRPARITLSGVAVDLPPAAFVQPTAAGEATLVREVVAALAGARRVADLYAGCGPFAFALAGAGARVVAVESDAALAGALDAAARRAAQGRIAVETRDLTRRPLMAAELDRLGGVVLDPPRPGAARQAEQIAAAAKLPVVAYVSCNPQSFARDARMLVDGGWRLERVTPLDQFLWSPHVELVAVFRR